MIVTKKLSSAHSVGTRTRKLEFAGTFGALAGSIEEPADGKAAIAAVFAHCFTCGKNNLAASRITKALAERGIATLRFDFTGLGDSEGEFGATGLLANADDIMAAVAAMEAEGYSVKLVVGHSYGGAAAIAASERLPHVSHIATIGAPFDVRHVIETIGADVDDLAARGQVSFSLAGQQLEIGSTFLEQASNIAQAERLARLTKSLLILHARMDEVVPFAEGEAIFNAAANSAKSFVTLQDTNHLLTDRRTAEVVADQISCWVASAMVEQASMDRADLAEQPIEGVVRVITLGGKFAQKVEAGSHQWISDEPPRLGGGGAGPTPYDQLLAALGTCTSMTLALYAARKGLKLEKVEIELEHGREHAVDCDSCEKGAKIDVIDRSIRLYGELSNEERETLLQIADRCPVHRTLENHIEIKTTPF